MFESSKNWFIILPVLALIFSQEFLSSISLVTSSEGSSLPVISSEMTSSSLGRSVDRTSDVIPKFSESAAFKDYYVAKNFHLPD
jgi:hypothetical protein